METVTIITALYAGVGVFNAFLYMPQILRAWRNEEYALGIALTSWGGWTLTSVIGFLFAATVVKNPVMMGVATVDFFGHILVFIPGLQARLRQ